MTFPSFFPKDRDVALGAVELALRPAFSLAAGGHEGEWLLIVNDGVMYPAGTDAVREAFHGEFHVFGQAVTAPAVFLDDIGSDAHAGAAKTGGEAHIVLAEMPEVVDGPEGDGEGAGDPGVGRILRGEVALQDFLSFEETIVHDGKEIQMDEVVGVKDAESVIFLIQCKDLREDPVHGIAFADKFLVFSFEDVGAMGARDVSGIVGAVVCDDEDVIEFFRIFQDAKVVQQIPQDHGFVVRRYDDGEAALRGSQIRFFSMPHAE